MESNIFIKINNQKFVFTYSEATKLRDKLNTLLYDTLEHKKEMELVDKRLKKFEDSSSQFPDELFIPKSKM